jgi:hypothetical protein
MLLQSRVCRWPSLGQNATNAPAVTIEATALTRSVEDIPAR